MDDLQQPVGYMFSAIVITLLGVVIYKLCRGKKARVSISFVLFLVYMQVLWRMAFFSREPGSRQGIDMDLFSTWGQTATTHAYFIENIMMFLPFGLLVPMAFRKLQNGLVCVTAGFLCSCLIEISQLVTQRGFCQLDDVVTNTLGTLVGWLVWKIMISGIKK